MIMSIKLTFRALALRQSDSVMFSGPSFAVTQNSSNPVRSVSISALTVKEIWQRILYDRWIVGVDVQNTGERYT